MQHLFGVPALPRPRPTAGPKAERLEGASTFPRKEVGQGEKRTRETEQKAGRQVRPAPGRPALSTLPACEKAPAGPAAGTAAGAAGGLAGASQSAGGNEKRDPAGSDATMASYCHHEGVNSDVILEACNMEQTASVSRFSSSGHVPGYLPTANRGGNFLNSRQSDVNLTSDQEPSCKGVA